MSDHPKLNVNQIRAAVLPDLLISIVGPVLIYRLAASHMPANDALLLAGVLPLIRVGFGLIRRHRLNLIGVFSLLTIALKIFLALVLKETRLILVSDSLITAVPGILLLASLLTASPLLLKLMESVLATTPSGKTQPLIQRWQEPDMRRFFTIITAVWGIGLLLECGVQVLLVLTLTVEQILVISPVARYGFLGALLLWTLLFARKRRSRRDKTLENVSAQQV